MERVLIVVQGLERGRIIAAISIHSPNRVIVLRSKEDASPELSEYVGAHMNALCKELSLAREKRLYPFLTDINIKDYQIDFFNLSAALVEVSSVIKYEVSKGNSVAVDISSGNKIVAIALFLAAQLYEVPITYSVAGGYATMKSSPTIEELTNPEEIAFSIKKSVRVPQLPIELKNIGFDLLEKLSSRKQVNSIKELVELVAGRVLRKEEVKSKTVVYSRLLEKLLERGYVKRQRWGRTVTIRITDEGEKVASLSKLIR